MKINKINNLTTAETAFKPYVTKKFILPLTGGMDSMTLLYSLYYDLLDPYEDFVVHSTFSSIVLPCIDHSNSQSSPKDLTWLNWFVTTEEFKKLKKILTYKMITPYEEFFTRKEFHAPLKDGELNEIDNDMLERFTLVQMRHNITYLTPETVNLQHNAKFSSGLTYKQGNPSIFLMTSIIPQILCFCDAYDILWLGELCGEHPGINPRDIEDFIQHYLKLEKSIQQITLDQCLYGIAYERSRRYSARQPNTFTVSFPFHHYFKFNVYDLWRRIVPYKIKRRINTVQFQNKKHDQSNEKRAVVKYCKEYIDNMIARPDSIDNKDQFNMMMQNRKILKETLKHRMNLNEFLLTDDFIGYCNYIIKLKKKEVHLKLMHIDNILRWIYLYATTQSNKTEMENLLNLILEIGELGIVNLDYTK